MSRPLVLAIDVGATKTSLTTRSIDELELGWQGNHEVIAAVTRRDPSGLVAWIGENVERLSERTGGRVVAVGVAAPGPLDAATGVVTRSSNLGWRDVPLAPLLSRRLGVPAVLEDDANTAALGEWHFGAGAGADPMSYVTVSSGIGGAVVAGGRVIHGATGNAGEVGHIVIDRDGPRCACGRRGDVESYAGGAALARRARRTWPRVRLTDGRRAPRTAQEVFQAARDRDPSACDIVDQAVAALAIAFAALAAVVEPELIVVGGSIGLGQRRVMRRAATMARTRVLAENGRSLRVVPAELGHESVLAGAADMALRVVARQAQSLG